MNYKITCLCGNQFLINEEQLKGVVTCAECKRSLSPIVSPLPSPLPVAEEKEKEKEVVATDEPTKRCPYCGEEILTVAKKCKHCGEFLDRPLPSIPSPASPPISPSVIPLASPPTVSGRSAIVAPGSAEIPPMFELAVSQWDNFWRYFICLCVAVVGAYVFIQWTPYAFLGTAGTFVILGGVVGYFYLSAKTSRCGIWPTRIETKVGVLSKDVNALVVSRVTELELKQNMMERLLGIGSIHVKSNDPDMPELVLYKIPRAKKVYKYLQQQVDGKGRASANNE
ncbi:MAG: PH domain-containing protein [Phycisphaerales bacterium]|nr:PH domain-containing protein [Phycisphaerales bacterium]